VLRCSYLRRQDGFFREILWVAVVLAVIAVVVLDGMSIFTAHQSANNDTTSAAREARTEYVQSLSLPSAKIAAEQYLSRSGLDLVAFSSQTNPEGVVVFTVKAKADAQTYVFKLLGVIPGLKGWVERITHPEGSGSSD
jgi:hypothetical protein